MRWLEAHLTNAARAEAAHAEATAAARHARLAPACATARRQDAADDSAERASGLEAARRRGIEAAAAITGTDAAELAEVVRRLAATYRRAREYERDRAEALRTGDYIIHTGSSTSIISIR